MVVPFRSGKVWSIDGTFDVCPVGWAQMYTISILVDHHVLPIVYDLLPSKSGNCYLEFLSHLNRLIPGLDPDVVITDFEKAAINAFKTVYPSSRMSGCMFHLGQSIQRRLDGSGMSESYASDRVVRKFVQALKCLAFVPAAQVQQTFTWLRNHDDFPSCLASTYAYFDKTYVSGANGNGPLYPLCLWNNRENVLADIPRTNNGIEGWHNIFRSTFGTLNKTSRNVVKKLRAEAEAVHLKYLRLQSGENLYRHKKYKQMSESLLVFVIEREESGQHATDYIFSLVEFIYY
ncbi:hypothetical protein ECANGB1_686 [Enterospora canceri]|uniref:MULE transposase domain-containing protein n=1 Tax=Enterospora canceri TaxID=1081671 RepID=A0A1Y1S7N1_9MICR|nr:hypothetical protein ECANGB1_686 [Enterospora canceri]